MAGFTLAPLSLRRRLILLITVAALLFVGLSAAFSYRQARHDVQEMMDTAMAESASLLLALSLSLPERLEELPDLLDTMNGVGQRHEGLDLEFQIVEPNGSLITRSTGAPVYALNGELGYADLVIDGTAWRSLVLSTQANGPRIQIFQSQADRDIEALEIAKHAITPIGFGIPILLLLICLSVRRGLRPLNRVAEEVGLRTPENLAAIDTRDVPTEASPLVHALNRLLDRLKQSLDNERRFTADAAHELRTPLAAVKVQAQVALATSNAAKQQHALEQVVIGTERATHLVEQLLRLARLDPLAHLPSSLPVDIAELAELQTAEMAAVECRRSTDLELARPGQAIMVNGDVDLLSIALRNLIDNALRYTPTGSHIIVFANQVHGTPVLGVRDTGPGVKPADLPKVIERFYRGEQSDKNGTGLGLAIVRRIAELHGARLEVANLEGGGFEARLRWYAATYISTNRQAD